MRFASLVVVMGFLSCAVPPVAGPIVHVQTKSVISRSLPPNVMVLVDRSSSMAPAIDASAPGCSATCPAGCTASCRTRWSDVQAGVSDALARNGTVAHWGLSVFPDSAGCTMTHGGVLEAVGGSSLLWAPEQQAQADRVASRLSAVTSAGEGHPLAAALALVAAEPGLTLEDFQEDFVLLITAGPSDCGADPVQAVKDLRAKHLRTIVVGFGPGTRTPAALASLDAMAEAGGFARTCPLGTDAECGAGGRCGTGRMCDHAFYQANDRFELRDALLDMTTMTPLPDPCVVPLEFIPARPELLTVLLDGAVIEGRADTWTLGEGAVTFQGALCGRLQESSPMRPAMVELRVVEP